MQCLPQGTRRSDHLQRTVYLNDIPLCHRNPARVARPSLPRAGDAIHPVLGKGVVWYARLVHNVHRASDEFSAPHPLPARSGVKRVKPVQKVYVRQIKNR